MSGFKIGDNISWNSEVGRVSGKMIKIHTRDFDYEGPAYAVTGLSRKSAKAPAAISKDRTRAA